MKVILKRDVKEVKNGYARNLLFPTGAAALADAGALANWERHRGEREAREQGLRAEAEATAERLSALNLQVPVKAGEKNRLFGSVTNREIAELIANEGIEVDRHNIHLRVPIKTLGDYKVDVHVMPGVSAEMTVSVVPLPA